MTRRARPRLWLAMARSLVWIITHSFSRPMKKLLPNVLALPLSSTERALGVTLSPWGPLRSPCAPFSPTSTRVPRTASAGPSTRRTSSGQAVRKAFQHGQGGIGRCSIVHVPSLNSGGRTAFFFVVNRRAILVQFSAYPLSPSLRPFPPRSFSLGRTETRAPLWRAPLCRRPSAAHWTFS